MKFSWKKLGMLVASLAVTGVLLTGCGSSSDTAQTTTTQSAEASAVADSDEVIEEETTDEEVVEDVPEQTEEASDDSLAKIQDKGVLVIGMSADFAPYEFRKISSGKEEIMGFDIELAKAIAEDLGVEYKIQDMDYKGLLVALEMGNIDVIMSGMTPTEERKKAVDFSEIYYPATQSLIVRKEDENVYTTPESLAGKQIGVQTGSLQEIIAQEQFPESRAVSLAKIPNIAMELKSGKVDGMLAETVVAEIILNKYPDFVISSCKVEESTGGTAIAMQKGSTALVNKMNETITRLQEEGKTEEMMKTAISQATLDDVQ